MNVTKLIVLKKEKEKEMLVASTCVIALFKMFYLSHDFSVALLPLQLVTEI